jgi:hypothetical protein
MLMKTLRQKVLRLGTIAAAMSVCVMALQSTTVRADDDDDHDDARARKGLAIAPVPLNLRGKNHALVGLGSYIVNAQGSCNECHANPAYAVGGDPFKGEPKKVNVAGYLAGGRQFGPFTSRNLTPDKSGRPMGGMTFPEFLQVMRTGVDLDKAHPQFGPLLQVMPWPVYQDMTRRDLRAIYEYLSAIPCVEGDPGISGAPSTGRCK